MPEATERALLVKSSKLIGLLLVPGLFRSPLNCSSHMDKLRKFFTHNLCSFLCFFSFFFLCHGKNLYSAQIMIIGHAHTNNNGKQYNIKEGKKYKWENTGITFNQL